MLKRIYSCLLTVCMLAGIFTVSAFAESTGEIKCSRIAYFNESGEAVTELVGGENITAKIRAKNSASEEKTLMFVLVMYKNNKIEEVESDVKSCGKTVTEYSASLEIPVDTSGIEINAFMWDNYKDMNNVCSSSTFKSSSTRLISLSVNGEKLENFSNDVKEYTVTVAANETKVPKIDYVAVDNGAKVEITGPSEFPGKSVVKITANDGVTTDEFTVNYTCDDLLVSDIDFPDETVKATYGSYYMYQNNFNASSKPLGDRGEPIYLDESLIGKDFISGSIAQYSGACEDIWYDMSKVWFTFKLKRSANISVYTEDPQGSKGSWWADKEETKKDSFYFKLLPGWGYKYKYTSHFDAGDVNIYPVNDDTGMFLTLEFDNYSVPAESDAELEF